MLFTWHSSENENASHVLGEKHVFAKLLFDKRFVNTILRKLSQVRKKSNSPVVRASKLRTKDSLNKNVKEVHERCIASLVTGEVHIKTTMRDHFTPTRMTVITKMGQVKC